MKAELLRSLPSIEKMLLEPRLAVWNDRLAVKIRTRLIQTEVEKFRTLALRGEGFTLEALIHSIEMEFRRVSEVGMKKVINATGVVLHTNLGRAPLGNEALEALAQSLGGYCNLEFDLTTGERGNRTAALEELISLYTQTEAGAVVNNNAAAMFLVLKALAENRDVIISRSELVQIGGGFRIPDILREAGAKLVEVGTTNITSLRDYENAITEKTAIILKVHHSNFMIQGHVESPTVKELAKLARGKGIAFVIDQGSGDFEELSNELHAGADVVCFSGDKLLGGAQAGFIVGEAKALEEIRQHPLYRVLRLGKTELFLLEWTIREKFRGGESLAQKLIEIPAEKIKSRAMALLSQLAFLPGVDVVAETGSIGGGALPGETLQTFVIQIPVTASNRWASRLLGCAVPLVCRIAEGSLSLDLRTVLEDEERIVVQNLREVQQCLS